MLFSVQLEKEKGQMGEITLFLPGGLEEVTCTIKEFSNCEVRVQFREENLEVQCYVCGVRRPIKEMQRFVIRGFRIFPFCSEECYLTYVLGRKDDAENSVKTEGLHVRM